MTVFISIPAVTLTGILTGWEQGLQGNPVLSGWNQLRQAKNYLSVSARIMCNESFGKFFLQSTIFKYKTLGITGIVKIGFHIFSNFWNGFSYLFNTLLLSYTVIFFICFCLCSAWSNMSSVQISCLGADGSWHTSFTIPQTKVLAVWFVPVPHAF